MSRPSTIKYDEGFVWKSVKQLMFTQLGGWVGLRDAATAFALLVIHMYSLTGTAWQGLTNRAARFDEGPASWQRNVSVD